MEKERAPRGPLSVANSGDCAIISTEPEPAGSRLTRPEDEKEGVFQLANIKFEKAATLKAKPAKDAELSFGRIFTDYMFLMDYDKGQGWHDARIVPYGPLSVDPAAMVLHYGQEVFEGLKAYKGENGEVMLFRPDENMKRLNRSNARMCIPQFDEQLVLEGLKELVRVEKDWIPDAPGTSLYIRPFIIAMDPFLGVHPSSKYLFCIILCPVASYYKEGLSPVKIYVETKYVRAVRGGTGEAKTGANYAVSLKAQDEAEQQQYSQVLWLDGVERKYIEEVGAMNIMFKIDGTVVTPSLEGTILPGITRKTCIQLLKEWGMPVEERKISIDELYAAYEAGKLEEAFGTGTAAVISPVGELKWGDKVMTINNGEIGPVAQKLYDTITGIQSGKVKDTHGWIFTL